MKIQQEIEELQKRIELLKSRQANCQHDYDGHIYDPEIIKEGYGHKAVGQGSDVWMEPTGYRDVEKPRWSRECKICGLKQYTYEQVPEIVTFKPNFK